ncbi:pyridoxamine 5'-phosphate oxidase family protein [Rhizohabitans arisaemae]|uniref:pyridoxamine 5'-phosphate oxidase family protein n=1 Tax=Rhizohabitans arisaemae TaxID=2720610 RepID=UPI0024B119D5|nr:pyridoxamine 5'-phosphate oxidase family protein [Rhizohabitans arisaemae]
MASWREIAEQVPELAGTVRRLLEVRVHQTLATLRADGSPRISGIETTFKGGEVWIGTMPGTRIAADLRRDPRLAIHGPTENPDEGDFAAWPGDAKLAGRAVEVDDPRVAAGFAPKPGQPLRLFRIDVAEIVHTKVGDPVDHLVVESWHEGRGAERVLRYI